jgi:hypothetical protein
MGWGPSEKTDSKYGQGWSSCNPDIKDADKRELVTKNIPNKTEQEPSQPLHGKNCPRIWCSGC